MGTTRMTYLSDELMPILAVHQLTSRERYSLCYLTVQITYLGMCAKHRSRARAELCFGEEPSDGASAQCSCPEL